MEKKERKRYLVPALEKGLLILESLAKSEQPLRITDIHEQMGIPKTTVFMILSTLETLEFIEKIDDNRYRATMKIYNIGMDTLLKFDIRRTARPYMEQLAEHLRYTVHLAIISNGNSVYIEKVNGPGFVQFGSRIGQSLPIHYSAVGKALAAYMSEEKLNKILENNPLVPATENTITSPEAFKRYLSTVRELGYAIEDEEGEQGVRCIGSAIFDNTGEAIAAISVTAIRNELPSIRFHEVGQLVKECCGQISEKLGNVR